MLEPRIGMQTLSQITSQNICRVTQLDQITLPTRRYPECLAMTFVSIISTVEDGRDDDDES
ncbi:unnamed protein product [Fusarium graminearum]|uniref:Uncharacterized protein n=1 Tax=Gibberella zeae TaxID=5518 RepID=A0A4E9E3A1_GIBZA|nr:unnamed protein product [Fusarium graminearum]CAF3566490.1 unnamed protein product [Fusarium graminearum]CAG1976618.1 unnamed protein product [Fusarium graminearum]CAG1981726.1 unnamed protein product [Fusarium graminearum]